MKCVVYRADEPVPEHMQDHGLNLLKMIRSSENNILHRLSFRAKTIEAVIIIRCAKQNSAFPFLGCDIAPLVSSKRIYDDSAVKISPPLAQFVESQDNYLECLKNNSGDIYVRPVSDINMYHKRNDLGRIILDRPDLFALINYERCMMDFTFEGQSKKDLDVCDEWD